MASLVDLWSEDEIRTRALLPGRGAIHSAANQWGCWRFEPIYLVLAGVNNTQNISLPNKLGWRFFQHWCSFFLKVGYVSFFLDGKWDDLKIRVIQHGYIVFCCRKRIGIWSPLICVFHPIWFYIGFEPWTCCFKIVGRSSTSADNGEA